MKKVLLSLFSALLATTALFADDSKIVFCRASTAWTVLIYTEQNRVDVKRWGEVQDSFTISDVKYRSIETNPAIWQTTYVVEDGYAFVTEFRSGENQGTGYATKNGKVAAEYGYCSE